MDAGVVAAKLESLRRGVARVEARCPLTVDALAIDLDAQDIIALNLSRAVQLCVDLALHRLSTSGATAPSTMGGAFDALVAVDTITAALAGRMKSAVGFRNLAVHQYETMDWAIVHAICTKHLGDFKNFAKLVAVI